MARVTYNPGDIEIAECLIYNSQGNKLDIRHTLAEFNIYYDLTANGIKCEIVMADSNGLIDMLPIVGEEFFTIAFKTPTFEDYLRLGFQIYKVSDRAKQNHRFESYVLHGISQEVLNSRRKAVSRSFKDIKAEDAIQEIYDDYLAGNTSFPIYTNKTLEFDQTKNNVYAVFPGVEPFTAINHFCKEAQSKSTTSLSSNYIFYETNTGWKFKTMDSMIVEDPVENFYYAVANVELENDDETVYPMQKIINLDFAKDPDVLENLEYGLFDMTVETIDPLLKRYTSDRFRYKEDFDSIAHIEKNKIVKDESFYSIDDESSISHVIVSNIGTEYSTLPLLRNAAANDPQLRSPRKFHEFAKYKLAASKQLSNVVINVTIPGNTSINVGDTINLHIPQTTEVKEYLNSLNLLYGKKFLVMSMRHTYNKSKNNFFTVLECVKDTYAKPIEQE